MGRTKAAPKPDEFVQNVIPMRGTKAYRVWLRSLSDATLIPASAIIRDALAKWAESRGLPSPPKI